MSSKSRQHADAVANLLHSFTKPTIDGIAYSTENDFKVVESRYNLFRQCMDKTLHTFVVMQPRQVFASNSRDRCGYKFGFSVVIAFVQKLSTRPEAYEAGLPASHKEIDAIIEYVEWTQEKIGANIKVGNRAVTDIDIGDIPVQDALSEGMFLGEMSISYG